ncbi:hypothetical protein E3N88_38193 [Mikania micrantha]|uniref:Protein kinase domain-containing protein n=1 Tax=Mikania micrantha TaxID=192012 RepID=A0A5N6LTA8_9ASTR|nr:hypothetical protein E3N88_38193 [Mikania micrantha]
MSKKTTEDVSQPTFKTPGARSRTSLSTRTSKSDQSPRGRGSSSVSSSVPASGSSSGNSYNKDSWKSSVSSRSSLSSLRDFLPENPHLYHFKEIFTATKGFLSPKYSSSSSSSSSAWRCVIRGDDVIVFQRKFKRPIDEKELRERLLVICKSHHSSLIKLRGASISGSYIYLVYDLNRIFWRNGVFSDFEMETSVVNDCIWFIGGPLIALADLSLVVGIRCCHLRIRWCDQRTQPISNIF